MSRMVSLPRGVQQTTSRRPNASSPSVTNRSSRGCASSRVSPRGSSRTAVASAKSTRCLVRLVRALAGSHSNLTGSVYAQTYTGQADARPEGPNLLGPHGPQGGRTGLSPRCPPNIYLSCTPAASIVSPATLICLSGSMFPDKSSERATPRLQVPAPGRTRVRCLRSERLRARARIRTRADGHHLHWNPATRRRGAATAVVVNRGALPTASAAVPHTDLRVPDSGEPVPDTSGPVPDSPNQGLRSSTAATGPSDESSRTRVGRRPFTAPHVVESAAHRRPKASHLMPFAAAVPRSSPIAAASSMRRAPSLGARRMDRAARVPRPPAPRASSPLPPPPQN